MLALYGHPFSSYTWKAQIALHALGLDYDFRVLDADRPDHGRFVASRAGPQGQFPVLVDGETVVFEATCVVEHLALHYPGPAALIPADPAAALKVRMLDRVFDNAVMNIMQGAVAEYLRHPENPDPGVLAEVRQRLHRSYAWIEHWLATYQGRDQGPITLIECAAAPSLFYADWVEQITDAYPMLKSWRARLNALPEVARCVEAARPYRPYFPLGAPDRD